MTTETDITQGLTAMLGLVRAAQTASRRPGSGDSQDGWSELEEVCEEMQEHLTETLAWCRRMREEER